MPYNPCWLGNSTRRSGPCRGRSSRRGHLRANPSHAADTCAIPPLLLRPPAWLHQVSCATQSRQSRRTPGDFQAHPHPLSGSNRPSRQSGGNVCPRTPTGLYPAGPGLSYRSARLQKSRSHHPLRTQPGRPPSVEERRSCLLKTKHGKSIGRLYPGINVLATGFRNWPRSPMPVRPRQNIRARDIPASRIHGGR